VSAALAKLRKALGDPLFVRTAHGMEPTPRAQALIVPARDVLARVEREVLSGPAFDPATASVTFTFALSDVGEMVFLPCRSWHIERCWQAGWSADGTVNPGGGNFSLFHALTC
jgi:DNA-binding transcriptional LysR family regulator